MEIKKFYQNQDSLAQIEEPYCGALKIMVDFYIEAPQDCNRLHLNSFIEYSVISAVKTICEGLEKASPNFPTALLRYKGGVLVTSHANNMDFGNFHVNKTWEAAVIFGCVYYVLANNTKISQKHLNYIEKVFSTDNESKQYFNKFKEPADQKRKELIANAPSEQFEGEPLPPSKRIVLTNQSETARVVKAMAMSGHFKHEDGSRVSEAEVGRKFCSSFGIKSSWDSLIQSAFKMEGGVAGTFDALKDKAVKHYRKVNKICD